MADEPKQHALSKQIVADNSDWKQARTWLAFIVLGLSIIGVIILAWLMISNATQKDDASQYVLASVLPLLGTWVGTVLAFYFSKDNFEAATRSARELLGVEEKLAAIPVKDVMISIADMLVAKEDDDSKISLQAQIEAIDQAKKGVRLPVMSSKNTARYVIHKSILTAYLSTKAIEGMVKQKLEKLTLKDLVDDKPDLKDAITSFGAVKPDTTLDKVKVIMEQSPLTQDVFVTRNGNVNGEVIGWITNVIVDQHSRV